MAQLRHYTLCSLLFFSVFLGIEACTESVQPEPETGLAYFKVPLGTWVEYDVDSIYVDAISEKFDTLSFERRDLMESNFPDMLGRPSVRIERYWKTEPTQNWTIRDVWFQTLNGNYAERIEENVRFVKMLLPVAEGNAWNGNLYNTLDNWTYRMVDVHKPFTLNGITYDSTLTVLQIDSTLLTLRYYGKEIWAKNVGLIYKKSIMYEYQPPDFEATKFGTEYEYRTKAWGTQ